LDERNFLGRLNSELATLRTDTFAVYLRVQARRRIDGRWRVLAERRAVGLWDRADCLWPAQRQDGAPHPDFISPRRVGLCVVDH
jgi:hypothetical protein